MVKELVLTRSCVRCRREKKEEGLEADGSKQTRNSAKAVCSSRPNTAVVAWRTHSQAITVRIRSWRHQKDFKIVNQVPSR
jgi:hypothetical protein